MNTQLSNTQSFDNQTVLIVGGSSGIGAATAQSFAAQGAQVTIASRSTAKLDAIAKQIGADVTTATLDFTDDASVEAFFANQTAYDHVVVTAGETPTGPVRVLSLADAYAAMNSKFWGAYRVARVARIREGGSLTLVSGFLAVRPSKMSVLQGAINAALEALARGLALELSPVRVNTVSPGLIETPLWSRLDAERRTKMFEDAAARLPARRVGQPEDVARAVLYLASNPYASGSTVLVDGGGAIA
ncbi:SDR family oxidoreductase [Paraburkholderia sp. DHOC27]|uniref:SDR family oxidoreductase n=1 Tax=Paraburkholderia sp. DHOC27 TaxID=2303330 RepID=UPI000E3BFDCF|nr:SDR family oxidoreductase [Paraburkholderia sp. DHOC27]RFU49598.1 SDR family oxidoreductase [Paraburkholderia sp. DHOC27]